MVQPVGLEAALACADARISALRQRVPPEVPIVAVEGFLMEPAPGWWVLGSWKG